MFCRAFNLWSIFGDCSVIFRAILIYLALYVVNEIVILAVSLKREGWDVWVATADYILVSSGNNIEFFAAARQCNFTIIADNWRICRWIFMNFSERWDDSLETITFDFGADSDHDPDLGIKLYHCRIWSIVRILRPTLLRMTTMPRELWVALEDVCAITSARLIWVIEFQM